MRLTLKLPAIVVVAILLTALASVVVSTVLGRQALHQATLEDMHQKAALYAHTVQAHIAGARSVLTATAKLPQLASPQQARALAALVLQQSAAFDHLMLLTPEGQVSMVEPRALEASASHRDLSFSAWFKEVRQANRAIVSDLHISTVTQQPSIVMAVPARAADGRLFGIWVGVLKLNRLFAIESDTVAPVQLTLQGFLTDQRGLIIAHWNMPPFVEVQTDYSTEHSVKEALAGRAGASEFYHPIEQERKIAGYVPIPEIGWAVVSRVTTAEALAPAKALTRSIVLASLALCLLIGIGVFLFARRAVKPIAQLSSAARGIGTGDFSQRLTIASQDEIGELAQEFNRMAAALAETNARLRVREQDLLSVNAELEQRVVARTAALQDELAERQRAAYLLAESEARRNAEMSAALEAQRQAARAALSLMEDALIARQQAESLGATLNEQLDELHRWQQAMLGREDRIITVKQEINELCRRLGEPPRYANALNGERDT